jgi:RHS repeat-associated protein
MLDGVNGSGANTIYLDDDSTGEHLAESTATSNLGYETDHLGSVLNGTVANATHSYGLYGEVEATQAQSREIRRPLSAATNPVQFGYAGYEFDPASQDYHTPNRQYSPTRHTWLSQDPTGHESGDDNYYRYVHNNPLTRKDPTGLDEFQDIQKLEVIQNTLANEGTQVVSTLIRGYETLPFLPAIAVTSVIVGSSALSAGAAFLPVAPALVRAAAIANLRACAANAGVCSVVAASNATAGYAAGASGKSDMLPARFMFPINSSATGMMGGGGLVGPVSYGTGFTVGKAVKFLRND